MSDKDIVIAGYSGHAFVVIEAAELLGKNVIAYTDKVKASKNPFLLSYLGCETDDSFDFQGKKHQFVLGLGDNNLRFKIAKILVKNNQEIVTIVHPESNVSAHISIGKGVLVARGACINPFVEIGNYSILNTNCSIDHECKIGEAVHIAPGAVLAGGVKVGDRSFIGANSVIKQGVKIGKDVIIGAGTVVLNDIPNDSKVVGNPGRIL